MRNLAIVLFAILLISCGSSTQLNNDNVENSQQAFYIGTYTNGISEGIYKYSLNTDGTLDSIGLMAESVNPSFLELTKDKKYLIVGNEVSDDENQGSVESYLIKPDSLEFLSKSKSGGAHSCFIATNSAGYVLVANYSGGNVGLLKVNDEGKLSDLLFVQQHYGSGSHSRQEAPHAHSAWFVPNSNEVIAVDLGTNELWFAELDESTNSLIPNDQKKLDMASESGPRHLTFQPNGKWIYVLNELNGTVSLFMKNEDALYEISQTISSLPDGFNEYNKSADIHISSDGKFLYASNRGPNNIAIFSVDGQTGELAILGFESTHGGEPRNFKLSPDEKFLLVANQQSNSIVSFKRNKETGLLTFIDEINAPAPVCVLFE